MRPEVTSLDIPREWPEDVRLSVQEACETGSIGKVRRALNLIDKLSEEERGEPFKLGIARTFTIETQVDALKLLLATSPSQPEIRVADLDNIEQALLDPQSVLLKPTPDAVLVLWRLEELHPRLWTEGGAFSAEERAAACESVIERIRNLCEGYAKVTDAPLFLSTLPALSPMTGWLSDLHSRGGLAGAVMRINLELLNLAAGSSQVRIFDFAGWAAGYGAAAFDSKLDLYARQPISGGAALISFAAALRRTLRALNRPPSKVLALDLDNTLWGGVLGEDGVSGLKIGSEYPGNAYLRIQQIALALKRQGVLLVLLSKNNWTDVEQAFDSLPGMALRLADFSALRVNWRPKHENLREVAEELNLGLDSFVFVDDQGFEREEMAYFLPEVKILSVADDPLVILRALVETHLFDAFQLSREDRARSEDYDRQKERKALAEQSESVEDFLRSLNLQASIEPVNENSLGRVVQMLGKTNQFNVTTRRHSDVEVRRIISAQGSIALTLSLRDRFGDQGIVGLIMAEREAAGCIKIDSFLLSCRAIGRGAELALWAEFTMQATAAGYKTVRAEYVATKKNSQVADLFDRLGMKLIEGDEVRRLYQLELPIRAETPGWINLVETVNHG